MKLAEIASVLNLRLENAFPDTEIAGVSGIEQAGPGHLTFVSNPKYARERMRAHGDRTLVRLEKDASPL